jgi:hypothetical protein
LQNAKLQKKLDLLQGNQLHAEDKELHAEDQINAERLRRVNIEGNGKAWEKERRTYLREGREQREAIAQVSSNAAPAAHLHSGWHSSGSAQI